MSCKRIYVATLKPSKKPIFVVLYPDGSKRQAEYIEIEGPSTLCFDSSLNRNIIRTEAVVAVKTEIDVCTLCGEDGADGHVHA